MLVNITLQTLSLGKLFLNCYINIKIIRIDIYLLQEQHVPICPHGHIHTHKLTFLAFLHFLDHRNTCYRNCWIIPNQPIQFQGAQSSMFLLVVLFSPTESNSNRSIQWKFSWIICYPRFLRCNFTFSFQWHHWWINHWSPKIHSPRLMLTLIFQLE